jgi:gamma-glutamyltranspeptidase/glutathione hydrolase
MPTGEGASEQCRGLLAHDQQQAAAWMAQREADTRSRAGEAAHAMVVANDARAAELGLATLREGGDAADAFVATALAETVLYPGVTSIAGFMHVLYYDARTKRTTYLVGAHRAPRDPQGAYRGASDPPGRAVAIPGAVFGFAELVERFGRRSLAQATRGAAALARDGFYVSELYASIVASRASVLERTAYGRATYLPSGHPVMAGDTLRLPAYAETLDHFAREGAAFFARGAWGKEFVDTVTAEGGSVSLEDLAGAHAEALPPIAWRRGGVDYLLASGPALGGSARVIFGLELLGGFGRPSAPFTRDWVAEQLRVYAYTLGQTAWLEGAELFDHPADMPALVELRARSVAQTASALGPTLAPASAAPHHSSAVVVVDADGDIAVGMHSINEHPFGRGIFVGGVPLATSVAIPTFRPKTPGLALPVSVSPLLALRDGIPVLALAQFNTGGFPADVEVTSAVIEGGLPLVEAVTGPRVASIYPGESHDHKPVVVVDPRYPRETLCALAASVGGSASIEADVRGVLASEGSIDAITIRPDAGSARLQGVPAEIMHGRALGY